VSGNTKKKKKGNREMEKWRNGGNKENNTNMKRNILIFFCDKNQFKLYGCNMLS
jgi:hypothetical protein